MLFDLEGRQSRVLMTRAQFGGRLGVILEGANNFPGARLCVLVSGLHPKESGVQYGDPPESFTTRQRPWARVDVFVVIAMRQFRRQPSRGGCEAGGSVVVPVQRWLSRKDEW